MLGSTMVYTSALGMTEGKSLDEAQVAKIERLLDQIVTFRPGDVVLDIGCGWGAAMGEVARRGGRAVGVTISEGQLAWAKQKYAGANNLDFRLMDYRDFNETVDHVVSVEMIEAVGRRHLREYFEKAFSVIRKDDRPRYFVLQAIVANNPRGTGRDAFLGKYIFPGGELPLLSQLREAAEGLFHLVEEHQFGLGYAHTLQAWKRNLQANAAAVIAEFAKTADWADKPEQAYRMMLFYLDLCTAGFRLNLTSVGQFTFCTQPAPAPR
jgi:cyclopropane-fatty-acyl-phospholipid synthase